MQLLCIDVGSGTQDILLLDTSTNAENAIQMVLPSPTVQVARKIEAATKRQESVLLTGETMGGGACTGALKNHLKAGLKAYATGEAALSFDDNLEKVSGWGVSIVSDEEAGELKNMAVIRTGDMDMEALGKSLAAHGVKLAPDAIAVAVLDHGLAPADESQRTFRFRLLNDMMQKGNYLDSLIFTREDLPEVFTRMHSVLKCMDRNIPAFLLDTGASAVLGASLDETVAPHNHHLAVNLGNSHTIAFLLDGRRVMGFFEHHTGALNSEKLEKLLEKLVSGKLTNEEVWNDDGHGAMIIEPGDAPFLVATGPRRKMLESSKMKPYFAAPYGNMMLAGCFGLARAIAIKRPEWREEIEKALGDLFL